MPDPRKIWTEPVTGIDFTWIPGGRFLQGQSETERKALLHQLGDEKYTELYKKELPRHKVIVDGFWMGIFPVTRGQFRVFKRESGYQTISEKEGFGVGWDEENNEVMQLKGINWDNPGFEQDDRHPVVHISWDDAKAMTSWLSTQHQEDGIYRLPTEAEWEYACRAGSQSPFYFGKTIRTDQACFSGNKNDESSAVEARRSTTRVDAFASHANPFGLCDMHGNVWEWCEDCFGAYSWSPEVNPICLTNKSNLRVLKGGSWEEDDPINLRSAMRPNLPRDVRSCSIGFRIVRITSPLHPVHHILHQFSSSEAD